VKHSYCSCGHRVFFDSDNCLSCGRTLGFDPARLCVVGLEGAVDGTFTAPDGARYRRCRNALDYLNCNWLVAADDPQSLCFACRLNEVIPDLGRPDNLNLWTRVEQAKRRLLYSLLKLRLPLNGPESGEGLRFRILEDQRRNPAVFENFIATAHQSGTITVNILEADDVMRQAVREQMQERYRTVLGHLRHESGHFYFGRLVTAEPWLTECRRLFGDERSDYETAMHAHYERGPAPDWSARFVSAYASSHPAEDFAETFAHFLHIDDALETAQSAGLAQGGAGHWLDDWVGLAITLNEILRSLGADDPYPFVLTGPVRDKLEFMNRLVRRPAAPPDV